MSEPAIDKDGYLVEPEEWDEDFARRTASAMRIELTDEHWAAVRFMRAY